MSQRRQSPSIHGRELRAIVLDAIPSLRDRLNDKAQDRSHCIMRVLFDHTTRAIQNRNVAEFVRCFRLLKRLVDLNDKRDIVVTSAIWTSYINGFRHDDPIALEICREIDPSVRESLFLPFTFPHSWLRETKIPLPDADRWRTCVTVAQPVEAKGRLVKQTCCGHFAIVALRLEPMLEERSVLFRNRLSDLDDAPLPYLEAAIEGVTRALAGSSDANRGVSYLRIDLLELRQHPVDSHRLDFVTVAKQAVERCFAEAALVEI